MSAPHKISLTTAASLAVANMVGTGVFVSLGFQVADIKTGFPLLMLWVVGGVFALCGALSYGELAAALPRSGGEFHFLSRIFHPAVGFLAGWVSFTAGFAAPIALAALAFGEYFAQVIPTFGMPAKGWAFLIVALVTAAHLRDLRLSSIFQNVFTLFKVGLIAFFILAALWSDERSDLSFAPAPGDFAALTSAPFAISLLFVMYAYAGWNASTYITAEVRRPERNVPLSLILATLLVMVLYVGLNWAFLLTTPIEALGANEITVGHTVAAQIFGEAGGRVMSALLSVALISVISSMIWAGPRVTQAMGEDLRLFRALANTNAAGIPVRAILLQTAIVFLMLTASFENVLIYVQFTLTASSGMAVFGVFWLRRREPDLERPVRTWGYPLTPALFLAITLAIMGYTLVSQPVESLAGTATVLLGLIFYYVSEKNSGSNKRTPPERNTA